MKLLLFRSLWSNGFNLKAALADCRSAAFDGIEGPVPSGPAERRSFAAALSAAGVPFIAEVVTGGGYVPTDVSPERHLDDFRRQVENSLECRPLFLTVLAGCDGWPLARSVEFFGRALECADRCGVVASFETHRSRPTFNPWATRELLAQIPGLRLTCDFSHWCCVCERLVLDDEPEILALCAARCQHVHARVGYDQGPQVPHPAAPAYQAALEAHERWWTQIWRSQSARGMSVSTMTPEFGPDGYLHCLPFTSFPVADLSAINQWMAKREKELFAQTMTATQRRKTSLPKAVSLTR